ncbi:hypothetical protein ACH3XW_21225 [Acanthocheilonema viteae]
MFGVEEDNEERSEKYNICGCLLSLKGKDESFEANLNHYICFSFDFPCINSKLVPDFIRMYKVIMTIKGLSAYVLEGIYSLRFAVILLTFIILFFIIVQICEVFYSFIRLTQSNLENDKYGLTGIIMEGPNNSRQISLRKESKETERRNQHKGIFDEKSSLSTSIVPSDSLSCSRKQLEENSLKQKYLTTKEQLANKLSITTSKGSKKPLPVTINSPNEESRKISKFTGYA